MKRNAIKRTIKWTLAMCAAGTIAGCTSTPVVHSATFSRQEPTPVRSLLVVVDDSVFAQASESGTGSAFARELGATLKQNSAPIPVTVLQFDSGFDRPAFFSALVRVHATQLMTIKASQLKTTSRGDDRAVWNLVLMDVTATEIPNDKDPSKPLIHVESHTFYHDQVDSPVDGSIDALVDEKNAPPRRMGMAILDELRADHVLVPDASLLPAASQTHVQAPAATKPTS